MYHTMVRWGIILFVVQIAAIFGVVYGASRSSLFIIKRICRLPTGRSRLPQYPLFVPATPRHQIPDIPKHPACIPSLPSPPLPSPLRTCVAPPLTSASETAIASALTSLCSSAGTVLLHKDAFVHSNAVMSTKDGTQSVQALTIQSQSTFQGQESQSNEA